MNQDYEDEMRHVVSKAARGAGVTLGELREKLEIREDRWRGFLAGDEVLNREQRVAAARMLALSEFAMIHYGEPMAPLVLPDGISREILPFEDDGVNIWLLEGAGVRMLVDAGFHAGDVRAFLRARGVERVDAWLITHDHRDHVGDVAGWEELADELFVPWAWQFSNETREKFAGGQRAPVEWRGIGGDDSHWAIRAFSLEGHCRGAVGYEIRGFERAVVAVGDAIFAGSVGGCVDAAAFIQAKKQILGEIVREFSEELLILPGHGPATSLGDELVKNPFLAQWVVD